MSATKILFTDDDLLHMPKDGYKYELIEGELHRMAPAGGEHGVLAADFTISLGYFVKTHKLGVICAAETGFTIAKNPDTTRAPDVAFISKARIPATGIPKGYWPFAPDIAVEVISPNDTYDEVDTKINDWFNAGTILVIVINPRRNYIKAHRSFTDFSLLKPGDILTLEPVIPGFSYPVSEIFETRYLL